MIKIVFPVLALCLVIGCSNINDSNVSSQDDTLQNYSSVLNFFPKKMVSHFPDVEGPNFIMYTDCVSPEGGALHIELEESLSGNNYEDIKSSYLERYTPIDSCLLIIDRFKSKDNFFDVQLSEEDKELIDLECYSSRFPIPNFWKYDYSTDKTSCKLPDDFEIYVIDASVGKFMPNELLTDGSFMPKKWKHGFSKGIAISKKRERIIYWFYVW